LTGYGFTIKIDELIDQIPTRYLFNQGILEDIEKIQIYGKSSVVQHENSIS
jgi:hypothetical protein